MQIYVRSMAILSLITVVASSGVAKDDAAAQLKRLPLEANDITAVTGLNIYKFRVAMKPATKFEITVSVQDAADAKPRILHRHSFTSGEDVDSVDLLLAFLPRKNPLRGVLLSQDEEVVYRVSCPRCSPSGIATIIPLPLSDRPGTRKTLAPMNAERSAELSAANEVCLIAILASEEGGPPSTQTSFPRAKVSLAFVDQRKSQN